MDHADAGRHGPDDRCVSAREHADRRAAAGGCVKVDADEECGSRTRMVLLGLAATLSMFISPTGPSGHVAAGTTAGGAASTTEPDVSTSDVVGTSPSEGCVMAPSDCG